MTTAFTIVVRSLTDVEAVIVTWKLVWMMLYDF